MKLIDTHAHLDDARFEPDRDAVIERARSAGVEAILISTNIVSSARTLSLARRFRLKCAVGLHPHESSSFNAQTIPDLRELAQAPEVVAIGETGLDYYKDYAPRNAQRRSFVAHLELARELGKPVVVHLRSAERAVFEVLKEYRGVRGVIHSFTGESDQARAFLDLGFYLSVNGIVTFASAKETSLHATLKAIPLDRLLLETDAPYLAPQPLRGKRNEPAYVIHVAHSVASIKNLSIEGLAHITTQNAQALCCLSR